MKRSTARILTTHVGSLARPHSLLETMREKENGRPYDPALFERQVKEAVIDVVRRQVKSGIDVVTDGEQGKIGFLNYVKDRLAGFSGTGGEPVLPASWKKEIDDFPAYYDDYFKKYSSTVSPLRVLVCNGPAIDRHHPLGAATSISSHARGETFRLTCRRERLSVINSLKNREPY